MAGETVTEQRIDRLEAAISGRIISRGKDPAKTQQQFNDYYRDAVTLKAQPTPRQAEHEREAHNRALFEQLKNRS